MSPLLTTKEYQDIASKINLPTKAFINGINISSKTNETFKTTDPATGEFLANISACDKADLDDAVNIARDTFVQGIWSKETPAQRKAILLKWVELINENIDELAVLESLDSGKPIQDCVEGDLVETMECISWYAEAIDKVYGQVSPTHNDSMGLIIKEPIGVVGTVLPWNFPLLMMAWKVAPALAAGNSLIVKPAEQTSMSALYLGALAKEAGLPDGVLNILPGLGEEIGKAIGLHNDIDVVSFTGSTEVGRLFLQYSAQSNLKQIILECGGKSPSVVLDDAKNLDDAAENITNAVFWNMGENCTSNSRLIVHESLKED